MTHIDQMPQIHTGSFLTKEQAEQFRDTFKNLTVVVRCEDCKNLGYTNSHWFCKWLNRCVDEDWFCADGERKGNE